MDIFCIEGGYKDDRHNFATLHAVEEYFGGSRGRMLVVMPYIGGVLSVNSYKIRGRGGVATNKTKRVVELWMNDLTEKVKGFEHNGSLTVSLFGKFIDDRAPDLDNLAKVILDAVKVGVGLDDKNIKFVSKGYDTGYERPVLEIALTTE